MLIIYGLLFLFLTPCIWIFHARAVLLAFGLIFGPLVFRGLLERRRAIIFTEKEILYRPPIAKPRRAFLEDVMDLEEVGIVLSFLFRPSYVRGIALKLRDSGRFVFPTDFVDRPEILKRLKATCSGLNHFVIRYPSI